MNGGTIVQALQADSDLREVLGIPPMADDMRDILEGAT